MTKKQKQINKLLDDYVEEWSSERRYRMNHRSYMYGVIQTRNTAEHIHAVTEQYDAKEIVIGQAINKLMKGDR